VTTPSKAGPVVLSLFGLPFLGMGLFAAYSFLNTPNQPLPARIGAAVFASVFAIIGAGLIFGSIYGYSLQKKQAAIELAQPSAPWLWKKDWAAGRAESVNKATIIGWWIGAALVNMLSLPVAIGGIVQGRQSSWSPVYFLPIGFGAVGLLVLFGAIRAAIRRERFGKTYFELGSLPFSPGGRLAGSIHLQLNSDAAHGIDLSLNCIRRVVTATGQNRTTQQVPLWEDSKNISGASLSRGPIDTIIPVDFQLPADAFQTDHDNFSDQVVWLLKVKADVPGIDYSDQFEVPVFRTSLSASPGIATDFSSRAKSGVFAESRSTPGEVSQDVAEPARHRVTVKDSTDGLEFHFRAGRNLGRAALVVVLAVAIGALFNAMLHLQRRPPMVFVVMVGLLEFVLILAAVHSALTSTRITVGRGVISWRHSVLGIGRQHEVRISDVDSIVPVTSIQQASSSGATLYSLRLRTTAGKNFTLVDEIESRQEARWIVCEIEKRAGLSANTQVEILNSMYGPPPQRDSMPDAESSFAAARDAETIKPGRN
jgi:hypothetical protein